MRLDRDDPYGDGRMYDMEYADHDEDRAWYAAIARAAGGPVVELGCGLGLVAIVAAGLGARRCLATDLVAELLELGVPGVHLYAMNRAASIQAIYDNLGLRR